MKILITGGLGFMGYHLAKHFCKQHQVTILDNFSKKSAYLTVEELRKEGVSIRRKGDVRHMEDLYWLQMKPDIILHLAAQVSVVPGISHPKVDFDNNIIGTFNVLEFALKCQSKVIFWSSNKVYPGPEINAIPRKELDLRYVWDKDAVDVNTKEGQKYHHLMTYGIPECFSLNGGSRSTYGVSKACADLLCQEWVTTFGVPVIINRFSCVTGTHQYGQEEQGWLSWFVAANLLGLPVKLIGWKGKQVRDVLDVEDVCLLIEKQIGKIDDLSGQVFNIGGGIQNTVSLLEALEKIKAMTAKDFKGVKQIDEARPGDQCIYISDIRKVQKLLAWKPKKELMVTIKDIVKWTEQNIDTLKPIYHSQPST